MGWVKLSIDETCHVAWVVRRRDGEMYLHAIGHGAAGTRVTEDMARARFAGGQLKTPWIPVLFPGRAAVRGRRSCNCVTAAAGAVVRGWFYLP